MKLTLAELAAITQGEIMVGDPALVLTGFSSIAEAEAGEITFLGNARYAPKVKDCRAGALLADRLQPQYRRAWRWCMWPILSSPLRKW